MSESVIFQIGAFVFVLVTAAVFLYGMTSFREWQDRDDALADVGHPVDTPQADDAMIRPDDVKSQIVAIDHPSGSVLRPYPA